MKNLTLQVDTISCNHCVNTIQMELAELDGVSSVTASADSKTVEVSFSDPATEEMILDLLTEINYPATI
jgi:copper ion binding protein